MSSTPVATYSFSKLTPLYAGPQPLCVPVALAASLTLAQGTVLAEVSTTKGTYQAYSSAKITAPATGPTLTPASTDGTIPVGNYGVSYSYVNAQGQTTTSPATTVVVASTNHIAVTTITLPTGVVSANWYIQGEGNPPLLVANNNGTGFNITALPAVTVAQAPAANTAYTSATGAQNPAGFLVYACTTDANGVITSFGDFTMTFTSTPMMLPSNVVFRTQDLVGMDAAALAALGGIITEGSLTNGTIIFA